MGIVRGKKAGPDRDGGAKAFGQAAAEWAESVRLRLTHLPYLVDSNGHRIELWDLLDFDFSAPDDPGMPLTKMLSADAVKQIAAFAKQLGPDPADLHNGLATDEEYDARLEAEWEAVSLARQQPEFEQKTYQLGETIMQALVRAVLTHFREQLVEKKAVPLAQVKSPRSP
jgi:hypothetical protein